MNASEARIKYFEKHVSFEHHVRFLAQSLMIKTKSKSLGNVIDEIVSSKKFKFLNLTASSLRMQKNSRNWLGHKYANTKASETAITRFKLVDELNIKIIDARKWVLEDLKRDIKKPAS